MEVRHRKNLKVYRNPPKPNLAKGSILGVEEIRKEKEEIIY